MRRSALIVCGVLILAALARAQDEIEDEEALDDLEGGEDEEEVTGTEDNAGAEQGGAQQQRLGPHEVCRHAAALALAGGGHVHIAPRRVAPLPRWARLCGRGAAAGSLTVSAAARLASRDPSPSPPPRADPAPALHGGPPHVPGGAVRRVQRRAEGAGLGGGVGRGGATLPRVCASLPS
jgi:hypothetical protein